MTTSINRRESAVVHAVSFALASGPVLPGTGYATIASAVFWSISVRVQMTL